MRHLVPAAGDAVVVVALVSAAVPALFDQVLRHGDERVGLPEVVAQNVKRPVEVEAGLPRAKVAAIHGAPPAEDATIGGPPSGTR